MKRSPEVERYLATVAEERRGALARLRDLCVEVLDGYEEGLEYGMPAYRRPGEEMEIAFASQARHLTLYVLRKEVLDRFREELTSASLGKGAVRFTSPEKIDFDVVRRLLQASVEAEGRIC